MKVSDRTDKARRSGVGSGVMWRPLSPGLFVILAGLLLGAPQGVADERGEGVPGMAGVAPLQNLLARVQGAYPGHILKVELEREGDEPWIYEVKLLTDRGRVLKLEYDAVSLELLKMKGRPEE